MNRELGTVNYAVRCSMNGQVDEGNASILALAIRAPLLVIYVRNSSILFQVHIQSMYRLVYVPYRVEVLAYLFGLKSLVTMSPGSMTRDSFGRSVLLKVCKE